MLPCLQRRPLFGLIPLLPCLALSSAQADDAAPYYVGVSAGLTQVSNLFRVSDTPNSDRVTSLGLLGGLDQRLGRQHLTLDASLQSNRYANNAYLNNTGATLRTALDWETIGNLSGTLSGSRNRALADFNVGNGVVQTVKKNVETTDEYQAFARLGVLTRYSLEAGWVHRNHDFTAFEYDRFVYRQNATSLGVYAKPGSNVRLGLLGRNTRGTFPRYPIFFQGFLVGTVRDDYRRDDIDFTTNWSTGGSSQLDTRLSRSRTRNSNPAIVNNFSGTTGSLGWSWQALPKLGVRLQLSRDTGTESQVSGTDLARLYNAYSLSVNYALSAKFNLQASASSSRSRSTAATQDAGFDNNSGYSLAGRWAYSRSFSLTCSYGHNSRDSSAPQNVFSSNSYGCNGQVLFY